MEVVIKTDDEVHTFRRVPVHVIVSALSLMIAAAARDGIVPEIE